MAITFTTRTDLLHFVRDMLQNFDFTSEQYDTACELLTDAIMWHGDGIDWDRRYGDKEIEAILTALAGEKDFTEYVTSLVENA